MLGAKPCSTIRMSIASFLAVDPRSTAPAGSLVALALSYQCACSRGCSAGWVGASRARVRGGAKHQDRVSMGGGPIRAPTRCSGRGQTQYRQQATSDVVKRGRRGDLEFAADLRIAVTLPPKLERLRPAFLQSDLSGGRPAIPHPFGRVCSWGLSTVCAFGLLTVLPLSSPNWWHAALKAPCRTRSRRRASSEVSAFLPLTGQGTSRSRGHDRGSFRQQAKA